MLWNVESDGDGDGDLAANDNEDCVDGDDTIDHV